ncbi:MAG TPA: M56 family metallopeptidase, partial [Bacteroidales bacterium]|nr:M56 family metallopeptidase [Bacteroidales bacterium]
MTAFIIKSVICMILLFGLYWTLLRKEKLFVFNRYFLIISVLLSFAVPFITIPIYPVYREQAGEIISMVFGTPEKSQAPAVINKIQPPSVINTSVQREPSSGTGGYAPPVMTVKNKAGAVGTGKVILAIYLAGFAVMLFRFCRNIYKVRRLLRIAEKIDNEWYRIALIEHDISPFSFLRTVYLNKGDYLGERIAPNVLNHELEHIRQLHSRDIIFFELVHIFFWFNPVLLLYKQAARINHEYLADDAVISNMQDMKNYAHELINFISRKATVPFTSGFSPSMIRLRLLMLNTSTSRKVKNFRILTALVSSLILLIVLSFSPDYNNPQIKNRKQAKVNDDIVTEELFFMGTDFKPLRAKVVFNGRILGAQDTLAIDPQQIKYIDILKDREAKRKYGKNAGDGVIEISTYADKKRKFADTLYYKEIFTVNNRIPEGTIRIPVSNLYSSAIWTYPIYPNQVSDKQWRTFDIMTRDFYKITGRVILENGEPFTGVYVTATDHPSGVWTDKEGRFLLEDVKPDAMAELTADGYEPLFFRVSRIVYTLDLNITLEKKNGSENGLKNMSASYVIKDFTGSWKFNRKLSRTFRPEGYEMLYNLRQYDGDSLLMNITTITPEKKERKHNESFVFNTVKTNIENQYKHRISCSINSDGKSFSVTQEAKNLITSWENKRSEIYVLSDD